MLYLLVAHHAHGHTTFLNLFRYLTFRAGGACLTALAIALLLGNPVIDLITRIESPVRNTEEMVIS